MAIFKSIIIFFSLMLMGACGTTRYGTGGEAEHVQGAFLPIEHDFPSRPEQALRLDWESQKQWLDLLVLNGARRCFPATVSKSEMREARVLRELMAGMYHDASNLLLVQRKELAQLERRLLAVEGNKTCYTTTVDENERSSDIEKLHNLLNSDNQFALDSDDLNPKYQQRLFKAAAILKTYDAYQIYISGHADHQGEDLNNVDLSQRRANKVAKFLLDQGLDHRHVFVNYFGESVPRYPGVLPHHNLVNRRVEIRVGITKNTGDI